MGNQIKAVVEKYIAAIHSQNEEEFKSIWAEKEKCTLISLSSEFVGLDQIYNEFLINRIQAKFQSIDLVSDGMRVNQINDNLAVVVFRYHTECILRENGEPFGIQGLETQVIVKEDGVWKLCHVHYS